MNRRVIISNSREYRGRDGIRSLTILLSCKLFDGIAQLKQSVRSTLLKLYTRTNSSLSFNLLSA